MGDLNLRFPTACRGDGFGAKNGCMGDRIVHKARHCYAWQIHYHIVCPVKYGRALLDEEVLQIIVETARQICERYDIEFEQIGCDRDHIHLLCSACAKVSPAQIVRVFKRITAREIFRPNQSLKKALWGGEFWTDGYLWQPLEKAEVGRL
jgi:putative transposase